ncbi:MAG: hypothetical protein K0R46_2929 [Herbinix sp.]|nr:hypothetical protein [Herbinix sp.]
MQDSKRINRIIAFLGTFLLMIFLPASIALADMGPKPELLVKVINPPEGEYYLDLLTKEANHYMHLDLAGYDPDKIKLLESYEVEGWKPGLVKGTPAPMWGELTGVKTEDGIEHRFGYVGVPDDFKLIIITPENKIVVSQEVHRKALKTIVTYDYEKNVVSMETPIIAYIKQFLGTCTATLLIEGILLLVFGFSLRKNLVPYLMINLFTQLAFTVTIGALFVKEGILTATIAFFPAEIIIIIIESVLFTLLLKEFSKMRRVAYAISANVLSAALGLAIMSFVYA